MNSASPHTETITAPATPPGRGGIGILRISGPAVPAIASALLGTLPPPRYAFLARFQDEHGQAIDQGLALYFPAPHSYTGEEVLELHGHGGPVVMDMLLKRVLALGARFARPGEFSERAFLNGKLDLAQAEAVADLIDSASQSAARAALRSLEGAFSAQVRALVEGLIGLRMHIEAAIDFPEEEIDFLADASLAERCRSLRKRTGALVGATQQGCLLHEGMTVVLCGRPNAGKSSLLNALAGRDTAIVNPLPGTTRDVLREQIQIDGLPLHLLDTAGLRITGDVVESEGVRRAQEALRRADRALVLVDDSAQPPENLAQLLASLPPDVPYTVVYNKIDLSQRPAGLNKTAQAGVQLALSATTGAGLESLREHLKACMGYQHTEASQFSARRRHVDAVQRAQQSLDLALSHLQEKRGELAAEELRQAQQALNEITGEFTADDLLGRIFSSFCIGK